MNLKYIVPILIFVTTAGLILAITIKFGPPTLSSPQEEVNFSRSLDGLEPSMDSESVSLKDGDTYNITAKATKHKINGQEVRMLSYNGSIPGPTIVVTEGDVITLNITNDLDVDTTIHPHGINGESDNDGVPDISQAPIGIGESYKQTIRFPEPGLFWYHPHVREDYAQASGMYANFIVRPKDDKAWPDVDAEQILLLSDISMTEDGLLEFDKDMVTHTLMGRFGNTQTVNGQTDYVMDVRQNEVTRLYITNTSSVRSYKFEVPGVKLKLIGGDNGLYEADTITDNVIIAPSERSIVDIVMKNPGIYSVENNNPESTTEIAQIRVEENATITQAAKMFNEISTRPDVSKEVEQLIKDAKSSGISKRLVAKIDMNPSFMQSMMQEMMQLDGLMEDEEEHGGIEWEDNMPNANSRSNTDNTKWSLVDLDDPRQDTFNWFFNQNDVVTITIDNSTNTMHPMQHPIHLHGQKFIVKSINGVLTKNRVFKDVVQVPSGDTYELVIKMENTGTWLLHCHISEHMESGMVGKFNVR